MEINGKPPFIDATSSVSRLDVERQNHQDRRPESQPVPSSAVEPSIRSREVGYLDELNGSIPEVREAKVEQVRRAIENGTYNVKAEQIADKIIGGGLIDDIF